MSRNGNESERALARQASRHSPDEPKARLVALHMQGHSIASASEQVGVSERTGWNWWGRYREVALNKETPEIMDEWARIVRRTQGIMHSVLDQIEGYAEIAANDHPGPLAAIARIVAGREVLKHAQTMNIYGGTGTDKIVKDKEPIQPETVIINFIVAERPPDREDPDVVEGEIVKDGS